MRIVPLLLSFVACGCLNKTTITDFPPHPDALKLGTIPHMRGYTPDREAQKHRTRVAPPQHLALPSSLDLRAQISPIKDQAQCGSCWDFGSTAGLESAVWMSANSSKNIFSEQYVLSCNPHGYNCEQGGDFAYDMYEAPKGGVLASALPYTATDGKCPAGIGTGSLAYHEQIATATFLPVNQYGVASVTDIKNAMLSYGVIPIAAAAGNGWDNYRGGVYTGCMSNPSPSAVNHIVALVGYQDDASVWGAGYWVLRNSWGKSWGEGGYMRIPYANSAGQPCDMVGTEANYVTIVNGPTPPPTPPPGPTPPPTPCTNPVANTGLAASITVSRGAMVQLGTKYVNGSAYLWTAVPPFANNAHPMESAIRYHALVSKTLTLIVTNSCGKATATTSVNVSPRPPHADRVK